MDHAYNRVAQFNEWNTVGLKFNSFGDCVDRIWCGPSYCYITALLFDLTWLTQSGGCICWQRLMSQILLTHISCILIFSPLGQFYFGSAYSRDKRLFCMGLGSLSAYGVWNVWSKLDAQCCHVSSWHVQSKKWVVEFCGMPTAADSEAVYLDRQKLVQQWVQLQRTWNQIVSKYSWVSKQIHMSSPCKGIWIFESTKAFCWASKVFAPGVNKASCMTCKQESAYKEIHGR